MKLLMISGDRSVLAGKRGAFWQTLTGFAKHWERIDVICPASVTSRESRVVSIDGIEASDEFPNVFFHPCPKGLWYQSSWIAKRGEELVKTHGHDVATVHEFPPFYNGFGARMLPRRTGIPYCLEIHHIVGDPVAANAIETIGYALSRLFLRADARPATTVRVVNVDVAETLKKWRIPEQKLSVVPSLYLDSSILKPDEKVRKTYDLVFCARLVANKGLFEVLDALKALPAVTMLVIGDGPLLSEARRRADAPELRGRVTFAGWIGGQAQLAQALQSGKVFVMHSKSEGGPRIAAEAMACGLPVVSTRVGLMPSLIEDGKNGFFTDGSVTMLRDVLTRVLSDEDLRRRAGQAATAIATRFDRETLLRGYATYLQSIPATR